MSRSTKAPRESKSQALSPSQNCQKKPGRKLQVCSKWRLNLVVKSTLEAEKTARVHRLFGASNYVNRADKAKKFSGNSSIFKWKNRKISSSKRAKYYGH